VGRTRRRATAFEMRLCRLRTASGGSKLGDRWLERGAELPLPSALNEAHVGQNRAFVTTADTAGFKPLAAVQRER
jgi:hypothetical protein